MKEAETEMLPPALRILNALKGQYIKTMGNAHSIHLADKRADVDIPFIKKKTYSGDITIILIIKYFMHKTEAEMLFNSNCKIISLFTFFVAKK